MKAYLAGIPITIIDPEESGEWNVRTYEFVTDHPPTSKRISRCPSRYNICGLLIGKSALLQKQILLQALAGDASLKLIHPLFGIKQVVCARYSIRPFSGSSDAYSAELELLDAPDSASMVVMPFTDFVNRAQEVVTRLGAQFYASMQALEEVSYNLERVAALVGSIEGFLTNKSGLMLPITSLSGSAESIFTSLVSLTKGNPRATLGTASKLLREFSPPRELQFIYQATLVLLVVSCSGSLTAALKDVVDDLLAHGYGLDDATYRYLWDRSLDVEPVQTRNTLDAAPSLVVAYANGNLDLAEELAYAAGQPFRV